MRRRTNAKSDIRKSVKERERDFNRVACTINTINNKQCLCISIQQCLQQCRQIDFTFILFFSVAAAAAIDVVVAIVTKKILHVLQLSSRENSSNWKKRLFHIISNFILSFCLLLIFLFPCRFWDTYILILTLTLKSLFHSDASEIATHFYVLKLHLEMNKNKMSNGKKPTYSAKIFFSIFGNSTLTHTILWFEIKKSDFWLNANSI